MNNDLQADEYFTALYQGLATVYATNTVRVRKPIKLYKSSNGYMLISNFIDISGNYDGKFAADYGKQVAE